jgi:hypothetical protein
MLLPDVVTAVTKRPIPDHVGWLNLVVGCNDADGNDVDGNDVDVPSVRYKIRR